MPFKEKPLPNLRCSAVGLVPKKSNNPDPNSTNNWRFIHDLSGATEMEFLGLLLCTLSQCVKVPLSKLDYVKAKIDSALSHKNSKITLRELQSLISSLNCLICKLSKP